MPENKYIVYSSVIKKKNHSANKVNHVEDHKIMVKWLSWVVELINKRNKKANCYALIVVCDVGIEL